MHEHSPRMPTPPTVYRRRFSSAAAGRSRNDDAIIERIYTTTPEHEYLTPDPHRYPLPFRSLYPASSLCTPLHTSAPCTLLLLSVRLYIHKAVVRPQVDLSALRHTALPRTGNPCAARDTDEIQTTVDRADQSVAVVSVIIVEADMSRCLCHLCL